MQELRSAFQTNNLNHLVGRYICQGLNLGKESTATDVQSVGLSVWLFFFGQLPDILLYHLLAHWQHYGERRTLSHSRGNRNGAMMQIDNVFYDVESDACAWLVSLGLEERLEDALLILFLNTDSVGCRSSDLPSFLPRRHRLCRYRGHSSSPSSQEPIQMRPSRVWSIRKPPLLPS